MTINKVLGEWGEENCFILSKDNHALIIDPGAKFENIKPFLNGKEVDGVLLTHGHFDHALYLKDVVNCFDCKTYGAKNVALTLKDNTLNQAESWTYPDAKIEKLDGDGKITIGNFEVEYFSTPGHSPCGMCYKIEDMLYAGDTLFYSGIGRLDLKGSDKIAMIKSLQKLAKVEFTNLYSGHGKDSDWARQKRNIAVYLKFLQR